MGGRPGSPAPLGAVVLAAAGGALAAALATRGRGVAAALRSGLLRHRPHDDELLAHRIRAELPRLTPHPGAIEVVSREHGRVELRGRVLDPEHAIVLRGVERVRGVRQVVDLLERQAIEKEGFPRHPASRALEAHRGRWPPVVRAAAAGAGMAALVWAGARRTPIALLAGALGLGLVARAGRLGVRRLLALGVARGTIEIERSLHVSGRPEDVFEQARRLERLPASFSHLREVRTRGDGRWSFVASDPPDLEWDAELTALVPAAILAWRSVEWAPVSSAGLLRFDAEEKGTRVDVRLRFAPGRGAGAASPSELTRLLGPAPLHELDRDLERFRVALGEPAPGPAALARGGGGGEAPVLKAADRLSARGARPRG